jgi:hypothetical protein
VESKDRKKEEEKGAKVHKLAISSRALVTGRELPAGIM